MNRKIMLIDDEEKFLRVTKAGLEEAAAVRGFALNIYTETDPRRAVEKIASAKNWPAGGPKVFIVDLEMPYIDGFSVAQTIRNTSWLDAPEVMFFTGSGRMVEKEDVIARGGRLEGEEVIFKGAVNIMDLLDKIMACLR